MTTRETLIDKLRRRGRETPSELLYTFVDDNGEDVDHLDCATALADAEAIAGGLAQLGLQPGDRVMLVHGPGLEFVRAFLGCLLARVVPVPVTPPNPYNLEQDLPTLCTIAKSARANTVLADETFGLLPQLVADRPELHLPGALWVTTSSLRREPAPPRPSPGFDEVAFVQYTSGSTSTPRGVLITHGNLDHQLSANARELGFSRDARLAMWVPHYHDFGLVSGILSTLHGNGALWMMSPLSFVQRPSVWFDLVSRVRATHTVSPNFGFDLIVRKSTPEQRHAWDLSALRVVMSAAEPIRPETVKAFTDAFAPSKLDPSAFCPAYGLAEHTVGVSVRGRATARLDRLALERDRRVRPANAEALAVDCVGCGRPSEGVLVRIVDPESGVLRGNGEVGEIWVSSPSKAAGYDGLPEETRETFEAQLPGDDAKYLRTGDLGFFHEGELFICGRIKDTIIVRGRNLYPQDIEDSVRGAHPQIRPGGVAAFAQRGPADTGDQLAVLVELKQPEVQPQQAAEIVAAIRARVVQDHRQACSVVILASPGAVLKTSSGKIRRRACRETFESGAIATLHVARALEPASFATLVDGMDEGFRQLAGNLGRWFSRSSRAAGGRFFHKVATTASGWMEATPDTRIPAHPFFASGKRYSVIVRHANGVQEDDAAFDNRGATLRVLDPARSGDLNAALLDLLLTTGRCFLAPTAEAFQRWMGGKPADRDAIATAEPHIAAAAWEMFRAPAASYTEYFYHSKTAVKLIANDGTAQYARFRLRRPESEQDAGFVKANTVIPPDLMPRREDDTRSRTFLHDELKQRLANGGVDYVLEAQLRSLEAAALDCTHPWPEESAPWLKAMTLHLDSVVDPAAVEPLHFNSLNAPADLAPPAARSVTEYASLEQLRQLVYEISACARLNQTPPAALVALVAETAAPAAAPAPKTPKTQRVCVIGAGPSGLSTAWHLERQGHKVTVLESAPTIAGKCASLEVEGHAFDWGGHLCTPQYRAVSRLVTAVGAEIEEATATFLYDVESRQVMPWDDGPAMREAFLRYMALREGELAAFNRPGLAGVAKALAAPASEWLEKKGLSALGAAVGDSYTSTGYGYLKDPNIPVAYFLKAAETAGLLAKDGKSDLPQYWTIKGGMQSLWERVAKSLRDLRCGVKVSAVERRDGRVVVSANRERLEFDRLVLAMPLDDSLRFLDATIEERELFGQICYLDYYTTVAHVKGLPQRGFYIPRENTQDPARVGHCVAFHHRYPDSDVVLFYSYGDENIDGREVERLLYEDVERMGGRIVRVKAQKKWKYFPHVTPEDMEAGFYDRLEKLQGQNSTYYVGSLFNFELIECNVAYVEDLVSRHFGADEAKASAKGPARTTARSVIEITDRLIAGVAARAHSEPSRVNPEAQLQSFGLDSLATVSLVTEISDWLGWAVATSVLYENKTLARVSAAVAKLDADYVAKSVAPVMAPAPVPTAPVPVTTGPRRIRSAKDIPEVRAYWARHFGLERWPFDDIITAYIERFVRNIVFDDYPAFERVRDRGCVYLSNHQVTCESALLSTIMAGLSGKKLVALAKIEGRESVFGWFMEHMFVYPGASHPQTWVYLDRSKPEELMERIAELGNRLQTNAANALVFVQGTRSTTCREPVQLMNPMFVEMALATNSPIIPVRLVGGLPAESTDEKYDVPVGYGKQDYWIGRPILPEELNDLGFSERNERVLAGINDLGVSNAEEQTTAPDPSFGPVVDEWMQRTGAESFFGILYALLQELPDPCSDIRRVLEGVKTGRLLLNDTPVDRWLGEFATRLYGPRGPKVEGPLCMTG